jgi:hypothetical protein
LIGAAVGLAANALFGTVKYRQTLPVLGALVGGILDLGVGIVRKLFSKR